MVPLVTRTTTVHAEGSNVKMKGSVVSGCVCGIGVMILCNAEGASSVRRPRMPRDDKSSIVSLQTRFSERLAWIAAV